MALVTGITYPNNGDRIKVENYNPILQAIITELNGGLDSANIETASLPWEVMASFTNKIPAASMQDDANVKKYRDESSISFVASGCVWSATSGLNATMTSGVVYTPDGSRHALSTIATRAFTASKDTYVDVTTAGAVTYSEVANGAAASALATDAIRIAKVVTNGSAVTGVTQTGIDSLGNLIYNTSLLTTSGTNGTWAAWTPTITAASGTFTTTSASGTFTRVGKIIYFTLNITITTVGTGTGCLFTLPITAKNANGMCCYGREDAVGGKMLQGKLNSATVVSLSNYDNSNPSSSGAIFRVNGFYEAL
jgi:hypothetical protein